MRVIFLIIVFIFSSCSSKNDNKDQDNLAIKEIKVVYNRGLNTYYLMQGKLEVKNYDSISNYYFKINEKDKTKLSTSYYENNLNKKPNNDTIIMDDDTYLTMPATEVDYFIYFENGTNQHLYLQKDNDKTPLDHFKYRKYKNFINEIDNITDSLDNSNSFKKSDIILL